METTEYNINGYPVHILGNPSNGKLLNILKETHKHIRNLSPREYFHNHEEHLSPLVIDTNKSHSNMYHDMLQDISNIAAEHIHKNGSYQGKAAADFLFDNPGGYNELSGETNKFPFGQPHKIENFIPYIRSSYYPGYTVLDWISRLHRINMNTGEIYHNANIPEWLNQHIEEGKHNIEHSDKSEILPRYRHDDYLSLSILPLFSKTGEAYNQPHYDDGLLRFYSNGTYSRIRGKND